MLLEVVREIGNCIVIQIIVEVAPRKEPVIRDIYCVVIAVIGLIKIFVIKNFIT
jgi:hypothetical protein